MSQAFQTTEPVPVPSGWRDRYGVSGRGSSRPHDITTGVKVFRGSHCRRRAGLHHNAALQANRCVDSGRL